MNNNHPTPTISELLSLLDAETLSSLTERLHKVIESRAEENLNRGQLLFEFLDEWITAEEEYSKDHDSLVAEAVLAEIEQ